MTSIAGYFARSDLQTLDLSMTPLEYFMHVWPDMTREDTRKFLGRYGVSGSVQTQKMSQLSDGQKSRSVPPSLAVLPDACIVLVVVLLI
jgi:ATP-binding cassette, subfamily F, member 2